MLDQPALNKALQRLDRARLLVDQAEHRLDKATAFTSAAQTRVKGLRADALRAADSSARLRRHRSS
jgi:hypothetical protein